jgi:lipopolysaccharide transport system ATP-binding protein
MDGPAVDVRDLWVGYRMKTKRGWRASERKWALQDVSFTVAPGDFLAVVGGNGSGKTTLLQCLIGVITADRGEINVSGRVASLIDLAAGFHRELTGRENLLLAGVLSGLTRKELLAKERAITEFADLEAGTLDAPLRTYSAGMILRVGFSVAVHTDPRVLLVDEVLAVGDEAFQRRCLDKVHELRNGGCAVVMVSHDLDMVEANSERVMVFDAGRVQMAGAPSEALAHYRSIKESGAAGASPR